MLYERLKTNRSFNFQAFDLNLTFLLKWQPDVYLPFVIVESGVHHLPVIVEWLKVVVYL